MEGFLLIDKPAGMTSHDVVDVVRRVTHERTVGHAGTLDPFATGLLIVAVGRGATKQLSTLSGMDKEYVATLKLGARSTTGDPEGEITDDIAYRIAHSANDNGDATRYAVREVLPSFLGPQLQTPPMFSAKKIAGKKLYELAREGKTVERKAVPIVVHELAPLTTTTDTLTFRTKVSSGTYIRTLGEDIAKRLGTEGYLSALRRTKIGSFDVKDAVTLDALTPAHIRPLSYSLPEA